MSFFLFHRSDIPQKPFIIIKRPSIKQAQKYLIKLLSGVEYRGVWEQTEIPNDEIGEILKVRKLNTIYEV